MKHWTEVENQADWANYLLQMQELKGIPWQFYYDRLDHKYDVFANMWTIAEMEQYIKDNKIEF